MIEAFLNYLAPMDARPRYYLTRPPKGEPWRNTHGDRRVLPIHDARALGEAASLDREGFALVHHETAVEDLYDEAQVLGRYYREVEDLVRKATGARRVVAFDHNLRNRAKQEEGEGVAQAPVRFVHNDYTLGSGPQRVRDLLPDEAEGLLTRPFAVINVWKPIRGPVEEAPLAFCDAQGMAQEDFVPTDLVYADRMGEIYSVHYRDTHRWYYYPAMRAEEAMLLKCYDSRDDVARFTAHSAVDDPDAKPDAAPRESIEVRTLAFF